jgi:hypothetical protein
VIGYSYQTQTASYPTRVAGKSNSIDTSGHYFSVLLYFGRF